MSFTCLTKWLDGSLDIKTTQRKLFIMKITKLGVNLSSVLLIAAKKVILEDVDSLISMKLS